MSQLNSYSLSPLFFLFMLIFFSVNFKAEAYGIFDDGYHDNIDPEFNDYQRRLIADEHRRLQEVISHQDKTLSALDKRLLPLDESLRSQDNTLSSLEELHKSNLKEYQLIEPEYDRLRNIRSGLDEYLWNNHIRKVSKPILNNYLTYLNYLKEIKLFSLGYSHSLLLTKDGKIYSWGGNSKGELGQPHNKESYHIPNILRTLDDKTITQLSTQDFDKHHSIAMDSEGRVYSWGHNNHGQLGLGDTENRQSPEEITFFADKTLVQISLGNSYSLALDNEGIVYAWGQNTLETDSTRHVGAGPYRGILGLEDNKDKHIPTLIPYFKENNIFITQVATGYKHSLALDKDGQGRQLKAAYLDSHHSTASVNSNCCWDNCSLSRYTGHARIALEFSQCLYQTYFFEGSL